jgi:acyl-CoA thioester hydrolase
VPHITELEIRVRSTDIDSQGIMNNARYFEYFEQARLDHLVAIKVLPGDRAERGPGRGFTIAETTCRFRAPSYHRDELRVRAWVQEVRNRSFILAYDITRQADSVVVAEGTSAQVWLDADNRPTPMDDVTRTALEDSLVPAATS